MRKCNFLSNNRFCFKNTNFESFERPYFFRQFFWQISFTWNMKIVKIRWYPCIQKQDIINWQVIVKKRRIWAFCVDDFPLMLWIWRENKKILTETSTVFKYTKLIAHSKLPVKRKMHIINAYFLKLVIVSVYRARPFSRNQTFYGAKLKKQSSIVFLQSYMKRVEIAETISGVQRWFREHEKYQRWSTLIKNLSTLIFSESAVLRTENFSVDQRWTLNSCVWNIISSESALSLESQFGSRF